MSEEGSVEAFAKAFNHEQDRKNKLIEKLEAENKEMKQAWEKFNKSPTWQDAFILESLGLLEPWRDFSKVFRKLESTNTAPLKARE